MFGQCSQRVVQVLVHCLPDHRCHLRIVGKLVMVRPAMLTVPSSYSSTSNIILSRKMLKSVGDNMHYWRT